MASKKEEKEIYVKQYPEMKKWLNECSICQTIGYKPDLPEDIHPGVLAQNIRKMYNKLEVDEINICIDCGKYWYKN
jgi:hypothetical protein